MRLAARRASVPNVISMAAMTATSRFLPVRGSDVVEPPGPPVPAAGAGVVVLTLAVVLVDDPAAAVEVVVPPTAVVVVTCCCLTTWVRPGEALLSKPMVPRYTAVIVWLPEPRAAVGECTSPE